MFRGVGRQMYIVGKMVVALHAPKSAETVRHVVIFAFNMFDIKIVTLQSKHPSDYFVIRLRMQQSKIRMIRSN